MNIELEKGYLVIRLKMCEPYPSASGKSIVIATTHGPKPADKTFNGKSFLVNVNAFYERLPNQDQSIRGSAAAQRTAQ